MNYRDSTIFVDSVLQFVIVKKEHEVQGVMVIFVSVKLIACKGGEWVDLSCDHFSDGVDYWKVVFDAAFNCMIYQMQKYAPWFGLM